MTARNRPAFIRAEELRSAIKAIMAAHSPLAPPLTAKAVIALLPPHTHRQRAARTIRHVMRRIRAEAAAEIGGRDGNLSPQSDAA